MEKVLLLIVQLIFIVGAAPLVNGLIKKSKALLQCRRGGSVLQPYADILKYLRRETVVPQMASWLTLATPYVCLSAYLAAGCLIPLFGGHDTGRFGSVILFIYLLGMARFFLAAAALEAGSAFGGMGSSREMMVSSLVEPVLAIGLFGLVVMSGHADLTGLYGQGGQAAAIVAFIGLLIVVIAETGRIPVDNPDTHLELTMIHEAMLLEYSGRPLGMLHLAAMVKQIVLLMLLVQLFLPETFGLPVLWGLPMLLLKVIVLGLVLALIETAFAKLRLFKLPELLAGGAAFCILSIIMNIL